ncbi:exocyst complex component 7-like isoform X2 [Varroa jacobsoni]|nr:exocyst complex component 7-like isoform X2 [Varroa destructor]XP_022655151.1 exocyst complex component 7-like isoform X2 [Varroa destructor]XP_022699338.1 exocyst complex component 7-like isoform X2 [Varroa jacobsoni]XP_022699339.1 exocyst complex component 7-like isoform X2 [Varroa jacobsoni]XP_022699340.1 exocyst complex component 7-like isoform X2 [Varroa jacobsoni]
MHSVDVKLRLEERNMAELRGLLHRSTDLTNNICGILNSFDDRLERLEKTITPVHKQTGSLQKRQENINLVLKKLDAVIPMYNVAERLRGIVARGPAQQNNIKDYMETIEELRRALEFFEKSSPLNAEVPALKNLIQQGQSLLLQHFEDQLNSHSRPLTASAILEMIEIDEELRSIDSTRSLDQIPKEVQDELREMASYLSRCGLETRVMEKYGTVRSRVLLQCMANLREFQKTASGSNCSNSHLAIIGVSLSPLPHRRSGTLVKEGGGGRSKGRRTLDALLKNAGFKRPSADAQTASRYIFSRENREDVEVEGFLTSVSALLKLMQSEAALLKAVLPERRPAILNQNEAANLTSADKAVFEHVVQAAVAAVMMEGENLDKVVKESATRHEFQIVLSLFPALQHLTQIRPEYEQLMEGCTQKDQLCKASVRMQATLNKSLNEFVESVKNDLVVKMPPDGTVHELTSNVMMMLERLLSFVDMFCWNPLSFVPSAADISPIRNSAVVKSKRIKSGRKTLPTVNKQSKVLSPEKADFIFARVGNVLVVPDLTKLSKAEDRNRCTLSQYVHMVLSALSLNINNKAENYTDEYLQAIFRLNNLHYVYQSLQRSGLLEVVQEFYPSMGDHYLENLREEKRKYSQSWSHVLHYIVDLDRSLTVASPRSPTDSQKMKEKDRQIIKEKFAGFNKAMDEILRTQKQYAVHDAELRETIKRDNAEFIVPKYRLFYNTYSDVPFTKNRDKYIKYTPIDISDMINMFFDTSA